MMRLLAQFEPLAAWLVHPGLFAAGAGLVALPILIHLLNRRRPVVVEWAAMDFLLAAEKQNRRRIRLEDLLLLALRCLAVALIGLLVARPFIPASVGAGLAEGGQYERIVLLDDSLSMQASSGNQSPFDAARRRLVELATALARQSGENTLTVLSVTRPERPLQAATPVSDASLDRLRAALEQLTPTDRAGRFDAALDQLEAKLAHPAENQARVLYVITDLRQRDWLPVDASGDSPLKTAEPPALLGRLAELSRRLAGCYLIDVGPGADRNVTIVSVQADGPLVVGVPAAIDVTIANQSAIATSAGRATLASEGALPLEAVVPPLAGGESAAVRFQLTLPDDGQAAGSDGAAEAAVAAPKRVTIRFHSGEAAAEDLLAIDSTAYFAARPTRGIRVLVVDGDPAAAYGRDESYYLVRALAPPGPVPSGILPAVVAADEFDAVTLDDVTVAFLLNVSQLGDRPDENAARLEKWTRGGGTVVIMPGDKTDAAAFHRYFWRGGQGVAPLALTTIQGDESRQTWVQLSVEDAHHPVLRPFAGQNNPLLESVQVFRWWGGTPTRGSGPGDVAVLLRLSDADRTPALVARPLGEGHVWQFAIPADADWHTWPSEPSYLLAMQDLVRTLASGRATAGQLRVGESFGHEIDITRYDPSGVLAGPSELRAELAAVAPAGAADSDNPVTWRVEYPEVPERGFYELTLTRREGTSQQVLFAVNVDPGEGDLKRADTAVVQRELAGSNVKLLSAADDQPLLDAPARTELARRLLWLVAGVLAAEQVLGWLFGRWRT